MAPHSLAHRVKKPKAKWSMTVMMNARDLSRDDDFLSHLLVEHLGTDDSPLQVHKMDPSRRLPKHDPAEVLAIVKKYVVRRGGSSTSAHRVKRAVDALLELNAVKQYLHKRSTAQINAFATHASRYFELYLPTGSIEISHTSRYSHRTGKSELCILSTTNLKVGQVISDLKGSLAHLTAEEDEELKKTDSRRRDGGIRRDFSVIHSNQKNKSHLFLGPARFVNHDCDHNVELFRDGRVITFRVIKPIAAGQEVTAHYGEGYFGKGNRHCLCQTCERLGRGGYTPANADSDEEVEDDSSTDEETREERIKTGLGLTAKGNPNERRTRRGVYAILPEEDTDDEDRIGATERVAAQVLVQPDVKNVSSETAATTAVSSSSSTPVYSAPPVSTLPSTSTSEDSSHKHHDRQPSDTSSALTSLPDSEKAASRPAAETLSNHPQPLTPLSSLTSLSSAVPSAPSNEQPAPAGSARSPTTPATSRMSTRSSTASQSKDKSKETHYPSRITPSAKEVKPHEQSEKRALRSSRTTADLQAGKEQPDNHSRGSNAPSAPQPRNSLTSAATTPGIVESRPCDTKRSSSGHVTKILPDKSQTKSFTPSLGVEELVRQLRKKYVYVPRCTTCPNVVHAILGVRSPFTSEHVCTRCKRHCAIFSAPWPNRIAPSEALSSSSSDSSSAETVIEVVREKYKDIAGYSHKLKHSKKHIEVKHPSMERPFKRRKTETYSALHARAAAITKMVVPHAYDQPRNQNGQFDNSGKMRNHLGYSHKKFSIPGGVQRSRAHRALNRETAKGLGTVSAPLGTKRRWGDTFPDNEDNSTGFRKTIRRVGSLPQLPVAKPLAALGARPSPNLFARNAWAASSYTDADPADEDSLMESSSELTELPDAELKPALKPAPKTAPNTAAQLSQKRKREPVSTDPKPKVGKTFYMKDEKKPMPKGWVLVTDSSEETGEDEENDGGTASADAPKSGKLQPGTNSQADQITNCLDAGPDSASASTPSLAHTPSSRATSTPTQSSGTLVEDHASVTPMVTKRPAVTYSLRRNTSSRTSSAVQSPKRRKLGYQGEVGTSRSSSRDAYVYPPLEATFQETKVNPSPDTASGDTMLDSSTSAMRDECPRDHETNTKISTKLESFSAPLSEFTAKVEQVSITVADSKSSYTSLLEKYGALTMATATEVPDSESKRAALEVSNIIHGTAFSYGHPDARTTWKPNYHYSELDGWNSDIETCL